MNKLFSLLILSLLISISAIAQPYKFIYYLDNDLASTNQQLATLIGKGFIDDSLFRVDFFHKDQGDIYMTAHFKDSSMQIMHGYFRSLYKNGKVENAGKKGDQSRRN